MDLTDAIREFVRLQQGLVAGLREQAGGSFDRLLLDIPQEGTVQVADKTWTFHKHGLGVAFESPEGHKVDVHRNIESPSSFDEWRLRSYFGSLGRRGVKLLEATVGRSGALDDLLPAALASLIHDGVLQESDNSISFVESPE